MKQSEIKVGEQYFLTDSGEERISPTKRFLAMIQNAGGRSFEVTAIGVKRVGSDRNDGVTIRLNDAQWAAYQECYSHHTADHRREFTISARQVEKSLKQVEAEQAERAAQEEERKEARRTEVRAEITTTHPIDNFGRVLREQRNLTAQSAQQAVRELDALLEEVQKVRDSLADNLITGYKRATEGALTDNPPVQAWGRISGLVPTEGEEYPMPDSSFSGTFFARQAGETVAALYAYQAYALAYNNLQYAATGENVNE